MRTGIVATRTRQHLSRAVGFLAKWVTPVSYPERCPVCGGVNEEGQSAWCPACGRMMRVLGAAVCPGCHRFRPFDTTDCSCSYASPSPLAVLALGVFDHAWRALVHALKYEGQRRLAVSLAALLADSLGPSHAIDLIIAVPTDPRKRRERGFGHAELLAENTARDCGVPFLENGMRQTRRIPDQTRLQGAKRWENMKEAFAVTDASSVAKKTVLVVDDVMTTGATMHEAARALDAAGAAAVLGAVVAINLGSLRNR